jgi:hypothetical protein
LPARRHIPDTVIGPSFQRLVDEYVFEIVRKNIHLAIVRLNWLVIVLVGKGLV